MESFNTTLIVGFGLIVWGNVIMMNYDGFREISKAARHVAAPQFVSGLILFVAAYVLHFVKGK